MWERKQRGEISVRVPAQNEPAAGRLLTWESLTRRRLIFVRAWAGRRIKTGVQFE